MQRVYPVYIFVFSDGSERRKELEKGQRRRRSKGGDEES